MLIALLVLVGALALRIADPGAVTRIRDFAFDAYQRIEPRTYNPETPVRIIDIDEAALQAYLAKEGLPPSDRITPEIYRRLVP